MRCRVIARALYDYTALTADELSFNEGDILLIIDDSDMDWCPRLIKVAGIAETNRYFPGS
jgi:SH3 domain